MKALVLATKGILGDDHSRITKGIIYNGIKIPIYPDTEEEPPKVGGSRRGRRHYNSYRREIRNIYDVKGIRKFNIYKDLEIYKRGYTIALNYFLQGYKKFDFEDSIPVKGERDITNILFVLGMLE